MYEIIFFSSFTDMDSWHYLFPMLWLNASQKMLRAKEYMGMKEKVEKYHFLTEYYRNIT